MIEEHAGTAFARHLPRNSVATHRLRGHDQPVAGHLITDGVVALRQFCAADADAHFEGEDDEMVRWLSGGRNTREGTGRWIETTASTVPFTSTRTTLAVSEAATGALRG